MHPCTENQPLPGHDRDLSEGSSGPEHEPHVQALPEGLQLLPTELVPPCRVSADTVTCMP